MMKLYADIHKKIGEFELDVLIKSNAKRIGILGASGSGKSMTLRSIAGIEEVDSGRIEMAGRILFDSAERTNLKPQMRNVGYMFQNYALFPTMSVLKNVMAGLRGGASEENKTKAREMLARFNMEDFERKLPGELSGGQQQRVALARIMVTEPGLILLDEPFSALDSFMRERMQTEMEEMLSDYQGQVIMVSHNLEELERFSEELLEISGGKVINHRVCNAATKTCEAEKTEMKEFTHFDERGNAYMVDVSGKDITKRTAKAEGSIKMSPEAMDAVLGKKIKKGDVLTVAQLAGIMGTKKTSDLIPLCHPIALTNAKLEFEIDEEACEIKAVCTAESEGKTGVEMEALTGVSIALLTVYDMCKAVDKRMEIKDIHLVSKTGGKSGDFIF